MGIKILSTQGCGGCVLHAVESVLTPGNPMSK